MKWILVTFTLMSNGPIIGVENFTYDECYAKAKHYVRFTPSHSKPVAWCLSTDGQQAVKVGK